MIKKKAAWKAVIASCALAGLYSESHAIDSASAEFASGNKTHIARVGLQWKWDRQWFQSNGTHIGGYWDLTLAQWHNKEYRDIPGRSQNITSLGITPVFRFQRDTLKGPYAEAGIGVNYLSDLYNNNGHQLSTKFEFGDHIGIGYVFQNNVDVGLKIQHFSNGGIKKPNSGVNLAVIRVSYPF